MYLLGAPLLLIPFAIYNIVAFLMSGVDWSAPFLHVTLRSGAQWTIAPGQILVAVAILILLVEFGKLTRIGTRSLVDHGLSLLLFGGMTAEFVLVQAVASPTFFLLLVISVVDFVSGIVASIGARRRAVVVETPGRTVAVEPAPVVEATPAPAPVPAPAPASVPVVTPPPVEQEAKPQKPEPAPNPSSNV
jgi:hypothetical protein